MLKKLKRKFLVCVFVMDIQLLMSTVALLIILLAVAIAYFTVGLQQRDPGPWYIQILIGILFLGGVAVIMLSAWALAGYLSRLASGTFLQEIRCLYRAFKQDHMSRQGEVCREHEEDKNDVPKT